jgi:hypothetical protein
LVEKISSGQHPHGNHDPTDVHCSIPTGRRSPRNPAGDQAGVPEIPPLKGVENHGSQEAQHTHGHKALEKMLSPIGQTVLGLVHVDFLPEILVANDSFVRVGVEIEDGIGHKSQQKHDESHDQNCQYSRRCFASEIFLYGESVEVELVSTLMAFPQRAWPLIFGPRSSKAEFVYVSHSSSAMAWFHKSAVLIVILVFNHGALESDWKTGRI